jgi:predicted 2-oxoglutarate/Fe(II)-dependent dioxygenase YbiX
VVDLLLIDNVLDGDTCRRIVSWMQAAPEAPASVYGGASKAGVEANVRRVSRIAVPPAVRDEIELRFEECRPQLEAHFGVVLRECEEPQFLRYRPGDFFVAHQDGNTPLIRDDTRLRKVSATLFLNHQTAAATSGAYGEGSLVFHEPFPRHDLRRRLAGEPGALVAFRAETTHEVVPIAHGERYTIVSWYR